MSKIGKQPVNIPKGVEVKIDGNFIIAKGPKGELKKELLFLKEISTELKDGEIVFFTNSLDKKTNALWGLARALAANQIKGVSEGFEKKLEIQGVGYKAALQGNKLVLNLGFSHPIEIEMPSGINFLVEKNIITVSGIDKELVGQTAANIRAFKKPEPYKGKGIRYQGEVVRRKTGKKAATAA